MATRYICHLYIVNLDDGRVLLTYDDANHQIARPVDFTGPVPLEAPNQPQTKEEHDSWLFQTVKPNGPYTMGTSYRRTDLPPIEEIHVEDPPGTSAQIETKLVPYSGDGDLNTFRLDVRNTGNQSIPDLSAHWVTENETPQPEWMGTVQAFAIGESIALLPLQSFSGILGVGKSTSFVLDVRTIDSVLSRKDVLSPERYWISIRSGEHQILRIPGNEVGQFLDDLSQ